MRARAREFVTAGYGTFGIEDITHVSERNWYASTNFHMQYFVDSGELNDYLHFWGDTIETWIARVADSFPAHLKFVRWRAREDLEPPPRQSEDRGAHRDVGVE